MGYIIFSIIVLVAIYGILYKVTFDEDFASSICVLLFFVLLTTPMINQTIGVQEPFEYQEELYTITGLELKNESSTQLNGHFILGTGYINGSNKDKLQYVFFANTEYGKQLKTTDTNNIYLRETDDEEPKIINIKQKRIRKTNFIDLLWGNKNEEEIVRDDLVGQIVVVPTNTIKIDYNIEI